MSYTNFFSAQSQLVSSELEQWLGQVVFLIPTWKWLLIGVAIFGGLAARPVLQYILKNFKSAIPDKIKVKKNFLSYWLQLPIEQPISWIALCVVWHFAKDTAELSGNTDKYLTHLLTGISGYFLIKLIYLAVDAIGSVLNDIVAKTESTVDDQLAPFATKTLKVLVVVLGALMILQGFGLNVMSLLAGLGLGGLALALAAQDTAANVFGSITILLDHPFKIGDWVKIQDVEGTVEEIGFRSTRIRTFYNSVIAIPNAVVAKEKIDNMGARPVRRIRHNLGLHYNTAPNVIEEFCDCVKYIIVQNEKVVKDTATVIFNGYGDSALNILVNFHVHVVDSNEEMLVQQKILLEILEIAKKLNVDFAYPTRTVYMKNI